MNNRYIIRDREAGNLISTHPTYDDACAELCAYEEEDRRNGDYSEDYYEIIANTCVRYGDKLTKLRLSGAALDVYRDSDPIDILEWTDGTYSTRGAVLGDRDGLSAEDVISLLEELADGE